MNLHDKVKSHHHIATWAIAVLVTVFAATVNTTGVITASAEQDGGADVSEKTKKFFNFEDGDDGNFIEPAVCREPSPEHQALMTKNEDLSNQMQALGNIDTSTYTPEQMAEHQAKMAALQVEMEALSSSFESLVWGPSKDCKIAIVAQMKAQMSAMNSQMESKLFATLDRVTATVAKVKTIINKVTSTPANETSLVNIKSNISSIELNVGVLRAFFKVMQKEMTDFLALATSNPEKAFDSMESFGGGGDDRNAASAADQLVSSFEKLEANVDSLVTLEGGSN